MESTGRFTIALRKLVNNQHDRCSLCGGKLPSSIAALAGYDVEQREIYVGECCKSEIAELASHIYWWWETYRRPAPDTTIWRYMDLSKFLTLVNDEALYFASVGTLGDRFEGAWGLASRKSEWESRWIKWLSDTIRSVPNSGDLSDEHVSKEAERLYHDIEAASRRDLDSTYVSCWHANDGESEAQWRLYAPPPTAGIAVRTTYGRLDAALDPSFEVLGGFVQYIDFRKEFSRFYDRIFWKRASLSHESEIRAVLRQRSAGQDGPGINVPLRVNEAFDKIVLSPFAPPWLIKTVRRTLTRLGVTIPVENSSLLAEPFF